VINLSISELDIFDRTIVKLNSPDMLKKAGSGFKESIDKNFQEGGRPEKWKPLKTPNHKILVKTGNLRSKFFMRVRRDEIRIGTRIAYAPYQQKGTPTIPPRPFLMFQDEDLDTALASIEEFIFEDL